jgi:hypothetical protein
MTAHEIVTVALDEGLITSKGLNPERTMTARLYVGVKRDKRLVKLSSPGASRARRGSVRWTLRASP